LCCVSSGPRNLLGKVSMRCLPMPAEAWKRQRSEVREFLRGRAKMRLLVVEDSERLGQLVVAGLSKAGYGVQVHHPQTMYASGAYVGSYDPS